MRLLIITQKVDKNDDVLGFFHEWVRRFAQHFERVEVICLFEGAHDLPPNVAVHSLGKERGAGKFGYLWRLFRLVFSLKYDAVFVHMNEEYVLLCGWYWRLIGKKVVMWRNHKAGSWRTQLAVYLSSRVCCTSSAAYVARYAKTVLMPIGIDTDAFAPPSTPAPSGSMLFIGRLDPVKRAEAFVEALARVEAPYRADLYGTPSPGNEAYGAQVAALAEPLLERGALVLHPGVPFVQTPALYRAHAIYVNLTPSGSFDKTIGEAMASGCVVVCANDAVRDILPPKFVVQSGEQGSVIAGIEAALALSPEERAIASAKNRAYIEREHSLNKLSLLLKQEMHT